MTGSEDRKGFILYRNYIEPVNRMTDEQAGQLFKAILAYANGEEVTGMDASASTAFYFIKSNIDLDAAKYEKRCAANRENGKKGGRPRKNHEPKKSEEKQSVFKETEHDEPESIQQGKTGDDLQPEETGPKRKTRKERDAERLYNSRAGKTPYAELVYLTDAQYRKLVDEYGKDAANWMVQKLDNYKGSKKKVYYDDYRAILSWVVDEWGTYSAKRSDAHIPQETTLQKTEPDTDEDWMGYYMGEK